MPTSCEAVNQCANLSLQELLLPNQKDKHRVSLFHPFVQPWEQLNRLPVLRVANLITVSLSYCYSYLSFSFLISWTSVRSLLSSLASVFAIVIACLLCSLSFFLAFAPFLLSSKLSKWRLGLGGSAILFVLSQSCWTGRTLLRNRPNVKMSFFPRAHWVHTL